MRHQEWRHVLQCRHGITQGHDSDRATLSNLPKLCLIYGQSLAVQKVDSSLALEYFSKCLIKPPPFQGTLKPEDYLREISYEYAGGARDLKETSEVVGEVVGAELVKAVIALCIYSGVQETCSAKDARRVEKALEKVFAGINKLLRSWPYQLDMESVAVGAAQNLNYLIGSGKPKVTLQTELNVGPEFADLRYSCVRQYSPVRLRELLFERIEELTGYIPVG